MTKKKIFFWLRVDKKFFDNIFIKRLKSIPGGYTMTVIYIRLMLESLDSDCILYYEGYFEDLKTELSLKLDVTEEEIEMTLSYFSKCGLIQFDEEGNANLPQAEAMIASETNWAKYKREKRIEKIDKLDNVQPVSNQCPIEIEIEIDKEIENKSNSNNYIESENILSGKPDYVFPDWLNEKSILSLEKTHKKEFWLPVAYLNQVVGSRYKFVDKTSRLLKARFNEGFTVEDFKKVIDKKADEWLKTDMSKYLRPETLFGSKFESYLNQPEPEKSEYDDLF